MPTPEDPTRAPRLRDALSKATADDMAAQKDLAKIYGVANSRISSLINQRFESFPEAVRGAGNQNYYPLRAALEAMIAYVEKSSRDAKVKATAAAAIMSGKPAEAAQDPGDQPPADAPAPRPQLTAGDMDRLASAATKVWKLEREQGLYIPKQQVEDGVRFLMTFMQTRISGFVAALDPNGELPPEIRKAAENNARELLLQWHEQIGQRFSEVAVTDE